MWHNATQRQQCDRDNKETMWHTMTQRRHRENTNTPWHRQHDRDNKDATWHKDNPEAQRDTETTQRHNVTKRQYDAETIMSEERHAVFCSCRSTIVVREFWSVQPARVSFILSTSLIRRHTSQLQEKTVQISFITKLNDHKVRPFAPVYRTPSIQTRSPSIQDLESCYIGLYCWLLVWHAHCSSFPSSVLMEMRAIIRTPHIKGKACVFQVKHGVNGAWITHPITPKRCPSIRLCQPRICSHQWTMALITRTRCWRQNE